MRADGDAPRRATSACRSPGVELRLVDDDGGRLDESDDETIGEIAVRGPNVFTGYLNRPDATAEVDARRLVLHRRPRDPRTPTAASASSVAAPPT